MVQSGVSSCKTASFLGQLSQQARSIAHMMGQVCVHYDDKVACCMLQAMHIRCACRQAWNGLSSRATAKQCQIRSRDTPSPSLPLLALSTCNRRWVVHTASTAEQWKQAH